jgi:LysR family transcriptional regulator, nitrogen assimilation regulatory protein
MEIKQLRNFVGIVDSGSLSRAADILLVAQPSLSVQLRALEEEFGTQLLQRSSQGVLPTDAGKKLYRHARNVLRQVEHLRQDVREGSDTESGVVSVGFPTTVAAALGLPLFNRLREQYPGIRLQLFESMSGYVFELLLNGRLDLAILFRESDSTGLSASPLFDEDLYVIGGCRSHDDDPDATCSVVQLGNVPFVAPAAPAALRLQIERAFAQAGAELNIVAEIDSLPTMLEIVRSGAAHTIFPLSILSSLDPARRPLARRVVEPSISRPVSLCWTTAAPVRSAVLAVRCCITELVRELCSSGQWQGIRLRHV